MGRRWLLLLLCLSVLFLSLVPLTRARGELRVNEALTRILFLASDHQELSDYQPYKDITYAAYFTDPTTNRTEQ